MVKSSVNSAFAITLSPVTSTLLCLILFVCSVCSGRRWCACTLRAVIWKRSDSHGMRMHVRVAVYLSVQPAQRPQAPPSGDSSPFTPVPPNRMIRPNKWVQGRFGVGLFSVFCRFLDFEFLDFEFTSNLFQIYRLKCTIELRLVLAKD